MSLGERLKQARTNAGLTQSELGEKIGVAKSTVAGYEKDSREPDVLTIWKIIKALGISGDWLIGGVNEPITTVVVLITNLFPLSLK